MNLNIKNFSYAEGKLEFTMKYSNKTEDVYYLLPRDTPIHPDLVGYAISSLIGQKFTDITFDLPLSDFAQRAISSFCKAQITAPINPIQLSPPAGKKVGLSFSAGFDSLACVPLLPEDTELTSTAFGGHFEREERLFSTFDTTIVKTNARTFGYERNHWAFMGAGIILLRDYLSISRYSFGTILEASMNTWNRYSSNNLPYVLFGNLGIKPLNPVAGLTEIGTAMIVQEFYPDLIESSLRSLATPRTEKYNRKHLIVSALLARRGITPPAKFLENLPDSKYTFGSSFPADVMCLWLIQNTEPAHINKIVKSIDQETLNQITQLPLQFMEKLNPVQLGGVPLVDQARILSQCARAGISVYDRKDWASFEEVTTFLSDLHKSR